MRTQLREDLEPMLERLRAAEDNYETSMRDVDWAERYSGCGIFDPGTVDIAAWLQRAEQDETLAPVLAEARECRIKPSRIIDAMADVAEEISCGIECETGGIDAIIGVQDETELRYVDEALATEFLALPSADREALCRCLNGFLHHSGRLTYEDSYAGVALVVDADALRARLFPEDARDR